MIKYNVYREDINRKTIEVYNIFNHHSFLNDCKKYLKEYAEDKEVCFEKIKASLQYYFWAKCEWEVIISDWPPSPKEYNFKSIKIDVYDQVYNNWEFFKEYVWNHKEEILKMK